LNTPILTKGLRRLARALIFHLVLLSTGPPYLQRSENGEVSVSHLVKSRGCCPLHRFVFVCQSLSKKYQRPLIPYPAKSPYCWIPNMRVFVLQSQNT